MAGLGDDGRGESVVVRVVEAVARAEGVGTADLDWMLQDDLDPDALSRLTAHDGGPWQLHFRTHGHTVCVDSDGTVEVDGRTGTEPTGPSESPSRSERDDDG
jgi:hypothetical protein